MVETGFFTDPSPEILEAALEWEKVRIEGGYSAEIITENGHSLLGVIKLDTLDIDKGRIDVPFGVWNENYLLGIDKLLIEKAKKMGVVDLLSNVNNDFDKLELLGLNGNYFGRFTVTCLRSALEQLEFYTHRSNLGKIKGWPNGSVRVEGLVQDFKEAFPGWEIKPMTLLE